MALVDPYNKASMYDGSACDEPEALLTEAVARFDEQGTWEFASDEWLEGWIARVKDFLDS